MTYNKHVQTASLYWPQAGDGISEKERADSLPRNAMQCQKKTNEYVSHKSVASSPQTFYSLNLFVLAFVTRHEHHILRHGHLVFCTAAAVLCFAAYTLRYLIIISMQRKPTQHYSHFIRQVCAVHKR